MVQHQLCAGAARAALSEGTVRRPMPPAVPPPSRDTQAQTPSTYGWAHEPAYGGYTYYYGPYYGGVPPDSAPAYRGFHGSYPPSNADNVEGPARGNPGYYWYAAAGRYPSSERLPASGYPPAGYPTSMPPLIEPASPTQECPQVAGYTQLANVNHDGDDIAVVDPLEAAAECSADGRCRGWSSLGELKAVVNPLVPSAQTCFYIKRVSFATIYDYLESDADPRLWPLFKQVMDPAIMTALKDPRAAFTLFAPHTDYVLQDPVMLQIYMDPGNPLNFFNLQNIISYHMVMGVTVEPSDFTNGLQVTNVLGNTLKLASSSRTGAVTVNGVEIERGVPAGQGYLYWLKGVMRETPTATPETATLRFGTVLTAVSSFPELSIFSSLYTRLNADLDWSSVLDSVLGGPFTLFVPTDEALEAYASSLGLPLESVSGLNVADIATFMAWHVITDASQVQGDGTMDSGARLLLSDMRAGVLIKTGLPALQLDGVDLIVQVEAAVGEDSTGTGVSLSWAHGHATIKRSNVLVRSGDNEAVIHIVDSVIVR